ncbi:alpha/beta hydrolase family protein [Streptomyces mexicanus]|uniref:alpha/beta hydrolase family protein n=1 Tax=Streptomyces mexicanus TaxID=178566 RepID=UPI00366096D9
MTHDIPPTTTATTAPATGTTTTTATTAPATGTRDAGRGGDPGSSTSTPTSSPTPTSAAPGPPATSDRTGHGDARDRTTFEALLLGVAPAEAPGRARDAGPVAHVTAHAPPFLVLHGSRDGIVPFAQGERLASALRAAGVPVDFRPVPGGDHLWVGVTEAEVERCFTAALDFATRCVR